jgi:hypothetical protein
MNIYEKMPDKSRLLSGASLPGENDIPEVNAHLHTPYSFSAFNSVQQAVEIAVAEGVKVAGINDFNTTDGYIEWSEECLKRGLFPLFNVEFIALDREYQEKGILVNDPNNPGRTYMSGKGLVFPQNTESKSRERIERIKVESNTHVERMCDKLNSYLQLREAPFCLVFREVFDKLTLGNIRERHLAKALRLKIDEYYLDERIRKAFYEKIFGGKTLKSDPGNAAGVENEIRGNLLKAGGVAYVPENSDSFPEVDEICRLITDTGGIPTYPFLANGAQGNFPGFEGDLKEAVETLKNREIFSVEFIPTRNAISVLEKYAGYCWDEGLVVTFGTEHNTPLMEPVKVFASGMAELTPRLKEINYKGACIIAAHQYLTGRGEKGYAGINDRDELIRLGHALIRHITIK